MKTIIPTGLPDVKPSQDEVCPTKAPLTQVFGAYSLDTIKSAFTSSFQQLVEKGRELQQVTDHLLNGTVARDFPRCDLVEGSNELFALFELPGVSKDDFKLEIGGGILTVRGEKKSRIQGRGAEIYLGECSYGPFERTVSLPLRVVEEKAVAEFTDGVLIVTIPKIGVADRPRMNIPVR
ncbi:MAG: Hsp20/alpha crystallin family protein [Candidatus Riflebacteria bacterium]|nr:Hsp20/alpha crystallin family protein [Candidatus Riflebacteria bacterium]